MKSTAKRAKPAKSRARGTLARKAPPRLPPLRIKTILLAMDFSEYSKRALAYAVELCERVGARLILLHVVESFPIDKFISPDTLEADNAARVSGARNELETLTEAFASYGGVKGPHIVCIGKPYQKIVETAKEKRADIIVLGSHGYTGIRRVYIGSTAERVVRYAPCHVMVVRE